MRDVPASPRTTWSAVACGIGFWPTTATGAVSQRPTHGACSTRTSVPRSAGSCRRAASCDPASSQAIESQTRTVIAGGAGLAFLHHVEVVIEGRHLVDLGHRHLHLGRQRDEMRGRQAAVAVLDLVEVLDQQVAAARRVAEQRLHLFARLRIDARAPWACRGRGSACPCEAAGLVTAEDDDGLRSLMNRCNTPMLSSRYVT